MRRPKYHSRYPSRLRKVVRRKLKDPYSAAHLQWVKSATDFRHRDAKTQMTASIVAARMAEEEERKLKYSSHEERMVKDKDYADRFTAHVTRSKEDAEKGRHPAPNWRVYEETPQWMIDAATRTKPDTRTPEQRMIDGARMTVSFKELKKREKERKMKTFKESNEQEQHLYHVTHTHHVDSIKKHGLNPMGGPSNWVQSGSGERYGKGEVYTFTHHDDAKKWAANMDWHHHQGMGTGKISIIKMRQPKDHPFEKDENDPIEVMSRKGPALKTMKRIDQKHIVGVQKVDLAMLKEELDDDLIEAINEWGMMFESTESSLNSQWIERQQRRKNPKLKEDDDKEEEGEKIGKKTPTLDQIAKKHGVEEKELERQLEMGIKIEYEHTRSKEEAAEIARDHLDEFPDYYDRLEKMEKKAKKDMKEGLDHVIMSRSENGFWSNKHGWVYDKASATKFSKKEKIRLPMSAGKDARMLHINNVPSEFDESVNEMVSMSVGGANIAGMPDADPPDLTPVGLGGAWKQKRKKKFAGRTVFTVDPGTYWKAYLGKRKYEHYEKYLEGCDIAEEIRAYGRKYWDEPIILQNEQTGAMIYLKYGSK